MPNSKTDLNEDSLLAAFEEAAKRGPIALHPTRWERPELKFTAVHCKRCGWYSDAYEGGVGGLHLCPTCGAGTSFVIFTEAERGEAERIVGGPLQISFAAPSSTP